MFIVSKSFKTSLLMEDLLSVLMLCKLEKIRSTVPLDTGKENNNFTKIKALDHSEELGALNNCHQTDL